MKNVMVVGTRRGIVGGKGFKESGWLDIDRFGGKDDAAAYQKGIGRYERCQNNIYNKTLTICRM